MKNNRSMKTTKLSASALILLLGVTGCVYQKADWSDINTALKFCEDKGGLNYIRVDFNGVEDINCMDGSSSHKSSILFEMKKDAA